MDGYKGSVVAAECRSSTPSSLFAVCSGASLGHATNRLPNAAGFCSARHDHLPSLLELPSVPPRCDAGDPISDPAPRLGLRHLRRTRRTAATTHLLSLRLDAPLYPARERTPGAPRRRVPLPKHQAERRGSDPELSDVQGRSAADPYAGIIRPSSGKQRRKFGRP